MKSKSVPFIAKILPIILFYIFFVYSDKMLILSITPLGRFIAICLILFYTSIHTIYGIIMALFVIFYYQMDFVEGMTNYELLTEGFQDKFRKDHCDMNGQLTYKEYPVKTENVEHIFPDLQFVYGQCNPCDINCAFTISQKLSVQEDMTYPKSSDDWVFSIWKTWFSEDSSKPFASSCVTTEQFSLLS